MKASFVCSALLGLLAAPVWGQTTIECVRNSTKIFEAEKLIDDVSETRTYILCTNTVFSIGTVIESGFSSDQMPILPRSNMRILCGESGSSEGNCTFVGESGILSATALQGSDNFFPNDNNVANNFFVSGVTFTNMTSSIIFNDGVEGNWIFSDIIVRDNISVRHITLRSIFPDGEPDLFASTKIAFVDSVFVNNRNLPFAGEGENAFGDPAYNFLFYVPEPSTELTVERCTFDENNYSVPIAVEAILEANEGFPRTASLYYGASLQRWRSNCFYNNYASRRALVDSRFPTPPEQIEFTLTHEDNYVLPGGGNQADLRCPFIRQSFLIIEGNNTSVSNECVNSTSEVCLADPAEAPSASPAPSSMPTASPAPTTSAAPTTSFAPVTAAPVTEAPTTGEPTTSPSVSPSVAPSGSPVATPETTAPVADTPLPTGVPTPSPPTSGSVSSWGRQLVVLYGTVLAGWVML